MTNEFRLFGPPGTGKTTRLATVSIPKAVEKYGSDRIIVTSFTRAAAKEIAGRGLTVDDHGVGTIHALCYRVLGFPELTVKHIDQWNDEFPSMRITGGKVSSLDDGLSDNEMGGAKGDELLAKLNIYRNKLIDEALWETSVTMFANRWSSFKNTINAMDFTDLIEIVIKENYPIPNNSRIMFVDEAQDLTPLQLKLVRQWGKQTDQYMLAGDDDQTIYSFTGASPEAFLKPPVPDKNKMILGQSYRIPRKILVRSMQLILQVAEREDKVYMPRNADGDVRTLPENFKAADLVIDDIEKQLEKNNTCMVLTSCAYMLKDIRDRLLSKNIPFGNKYRRSRGDWNPLAEGGATRVSPKDLLYNFLTKGIDQEYWNIPQFLKWAKSLSVGEFGLKHTIGKKVLKKLQEKLENNEPGLHSCRNVIGMVLTEKAVEKAISRDVQWLMDNISPKRKNTLQFPVSIYNKYKNLDSLVKEPPTTIGTIHSVKGGEADIVYLYPDISMAAENERQSCHNMSSEDALRRLFYVGMTRAKKELVLMDPITNRNSTRGRRRPALYLDL